MRHSTPDFRNGPAVVQDRAGKIAAKPSLGGGVCVVRSSCYPGVQTAAKSVSGTGLQWAPLLVIIGNRIESQALGEANGNSRPIDSLEWRVRASDGSRMSCKFCITAVSQPTSSLLPLLSDCKLQHNLRLTIIILITRHFNLLRCAHKSDPYDKSWRPVFLGMHELFL